jgi:uncharacterized phage protein gp47/JayE
LKVLSGLIEDDIKAAITNYVNSRKIGEQYDKKTAYNMIQKQPGLEDIITITPGTSSITQRQIIRLGTISVEGV